MHPRPVTATVFSTHVPVRVRVHAPSVCQQNGVDRKMIFDCGLTSRQNFYLPEFGDTITSTCTL